MAQARWAGADARSLGVVPDQAPLHRAGRARGVRLRRARPLRRRLRGRLRPRRGGAGPLRRGLPLHQGGDQAGRAARLRPARRQARLRAARQPRLRPGDLRPLRARRPPAHAGRARGLAARRSRSSSWRASPTARAAATTCPRACASRTAGSWPRPCARWARPTSSPMRAPTRSSSSSAERLQAEAGEKAPALLLGNFLERDGRLKKRRPRRRLAPQPSRRATGAARMVDVSRQAGDRARGGRPRPDPASRPRPCAWRARAALPKGGVVEVARLAGVLAAKRTSDAIPLCHPLPLTHVDVDVSARAATASTIEARVRTDARTGAEMEALHAVAVAALTVYDMVKAADKEMTITDIRLVRKTGGRQTAAYVAAAAERYLPRRGQVLLRARGVRRVGKRDSICSHRRLRLLALALLQARVHDPEHQRVGAGRVGRRRDLRRRRAPAASAARLQADEEVQAAAITAWRRAATSGRARRGHERDAYSRSTHLGQPRALVELAAAATSAPKSVRVRASGSGRRRRGARSRAAPRPGCCAILSRSR